MTAAPTLPIPPTLVVTRHQGLVEFARRCGLPDGAPVLPHATAEQVLGQVVLGVLPLHLAAEAEAVIEAALDLRPEDRGRELSADETAERFKGWRCWVVRSGDAVEEAKTALWAAAHSPAGCESPALRDLCDSAHSALGGTSSVSRL